MEAPLRSRLVKRLRAALPPLRVLVLLALLLVLVLPASVYAGSTSPAGTHATPGVAGRGLASSALPAGLRAALARDLGRAQPAGVAGAAPTSLPFPHQQPLPDPRATAGDTFGSSVALSGDGTAALIGALYKTVGGKAFAGAAYAYTRSGRTWTQRQELTAFHPAAGDNFGSSVALSGDGTAALVGADNKTVGGNVWVGAAYAFTGSGTRHGRNGDADGHRHGARHWSCRCLRHADRHGLPLRSNRHGLPRHCYADRHRHPHRHGNHHRSAGRLRHPHRHGLPRRPEQPHRRLLRRGLHRHRRRQRPCHLHRDPQPPQPRHHPRSRHDHLLRPGRQRPDDDHQDHLAHLRPAREREQRRRRR